MEGIARIKEKILEEAREEKQKIIDSAKVQARDIKAKQEQEAKQIRKEILERAKKEADEKKRRILSMAQLEKRKAILRIKQQIIDEVFLKAKANFQQMPDEDYKDLIGKMLVKSVIKGDEEVIISEKDRNRISQEFLDTINEYLQSQGVRALKNRKTPGQMIVVLY